VNKPSTAAKAKPAEKGTGEKGWVRQERIPLGILYMLTATILFAGSSALSKWLVATYPIGEMLFVRAASALVGTSLVILPVTGLAVSAPSGCAPTWCAGYRNPARRPSW